MPSKRVCPTPGCPALTDGGPCTTHRCQADRARGTRQARGYDATHDRLRRKWAAVIAKTPVGCARCGDPIRHGDLWHLDHTDDRTTYLGPSCAYCNASAGGKAAH